MIWPRYLLLSLAMVLAYLLKAHFSTATVEELHYILAPTTSVVEFLTAQKFSFLKDVGYMNPEQTFAIAKPCSGLNFFITATLMLLFLYLRGSWPQLLGKMLLVVLCTFVFTVWLNAGRIIMAMVLHSNIEWFEMSFARLHHIQGIVVYFAALVGLYSITSRLKQREVAL